MKTNVNAICGLAMAFVFLLAPSLPGFCAVHYVDLNSLNPTPPYTNWATAATVIQDAVDVTAAGDEVVVTNGIYAAGGRVVYGSLTNRVALTRSVFLHSVNGPNATVIQGYQVPGTTNGDGAIRCVYLTNGASLGGFTLTSGATGSGDFDQEQSGGGVWCESAMGIISNSVLSGNSASKIGGGAYRGTLINCALVANSATWGGGAGTDYGDADGLKVYNSTFSTNSADWGGGAYYADVDKCTLLGNSAAGGGGACFGTLNGSELIGNSATDWGGAVYGGTLSNCALIGNSTLGSGGAAAAVGWAETLQLNNCTLIGNSAGASGGGAYVGTPNNAVLNNCIVFYNTAQAPGEENYGPYTFLSYCCTTPLPLGGTNNISADPLLTDSAHESAASPCRGAGSAAFVSGTDIDGQPWANPPSIGCDEYYPGASGPLQVTVNADYTNVAAGFLVHLSGTILGHASSNRWDFGDGTIVNSQIYTPLLSHAWTNPGSYAVTLTAYNDTNPSGISASVTVYVVVQPVSYVSLASTNPLPPYGSWATAATNIQDAVDVATVGGTTVIVADGTYAVGGRSVDGYNTNKVTVDKPLVIRSVNGPALTVIDGGHSNRCVYLGAVATLSGFTLTGGYADNGGGGVLPKLIEFSFEL